MHTQPGYYSTCVLYLVSFLVVEGCYICVGVCLRIWGFSGWYIPSLDCGRY